VTWLGFPQLIVYVAGLVLCSMTAWRLTSSRFFPRRHATGAGWALCPFALLGGLAIASATTPDPSPIAILWLYLPYFAFASWALYFSLFRKRGRDTWWAGRLALRLAMPSLLLVPLLATATVLVLAAL
jgi:hypothetical protein